MFASLARFARQGSLKDSTIVLHDRVPENARLMGAWGEAAARREGLPLRFVTADSLPSALDGADFVLSTFRTGGLDSRYQDETIPLRHGELGVETVGLGGIFMALRCIPDVVTLTQAVRKHCPDAWIINYTNPTNMVTDATLRCGHTRTLGLCDGVYGVKWLICKLLGLPCGKAGEIEAYVAGINHCTWTMKLFYHGRDLYRELPDILKTADLQPAGYQSEVGNKLDQVQVEAIRLYRYYGILPGSVYYTRYYYALREVMAHHLAPGFQQRSEWLRDLAARKRGMIARQLKEGCASLAAYDDEDSSHGDQAVGALNAVANDTRKLEVANVVNNGAVPNLPNDAVVEVACILGRHGALPVAAGPLPFAVQDIVRAAHACAKLTVDGALSGDRNLVLQAALVHPVHRDLDTAEKVIDALFVAHRQWLPQFFST